MDRAERETFDEAFATADGSSVGHPAWFRAAKRMNAHNPCLLLEQPDSPVDKP